MILLRKTKICATQSGSGPHPVQPGHGNFTNFRPRVPLAPGYGGTGRRGWEQHSRDQCVQFDHLWPNNHLRHYFYSSRLTVFKLGLENHTYRTDSLPSLGGLCYAIFAKGLGVNPSNNFDNRCPCCLSRFFFQVGLTIQLSIYSYGDQCHTRNPTDTATTLHIF